MKVEKVGPGQYRVQSQSDPEIWYEVALEPEASCSCPDFEKRRKGNGQVCKHIRAARKKAGVKVSEDEWVSKNGYEMSEVVSALQKSIRRSDEEAAGYWSCEMIDSGYGSYLLHRLSVIAAEDVGLANPLASVIVGVVKETIAARLEDQRKRGRWASFPTEMVGFLILYLCRAPKSRQADDFMWLIQRRRKAGWKAEVPGYALDEHTKRGKERIKELAKEKGLTQQEMAEQIFYREAGLLGNMKDVGGRDWSRELFEDMELPYTGYRLEE